MHEMGVANSILDAARAEVARYPGAKLRKVGVRVGEWSGLEPESLRFCFDCLVADADPPAPALDIQICSRRNLCLQCGDQFQIEGFVVDCPACGASTTQAIGGDELNLAYVEMEDE